MLGYSVYSTNNVLLMLMYWPVSALNSSRGEQSLNNFAILMPVKHDSFWCDCSPSMQ